MRNLSARIFALCTTMLLCATTFATNCDEVTILLDTEYGGKIQNKRQIVAVSVTEDGKQLVYQGHFTDDANSLEERIRSSLINAKEDRELPYVYYKDFNTKDGVISMRGTDYYLSIIFSLSIDTENSYYQPLIQMFARVLNSLREQCAQQYFHTSYGNLNTEQRQIINELYPACIYVEHTTAAPPPPPVF